MFEVNVLGMMVLTQKFAIDMQKDAKDISSSVASMAGKMATAKSTIYSADPKFACFGLSKCVTFRVEAFTRSPAGHYGEIPDQIETEFLIRLIEVVAIWKKVPGHLPWIQLNVAQTIVRAMKHPNVR